MSSKVAASDRMTPEEAQKEDKMIEGSRVQVVKVPVAAPVKTAVKSQAKQEAKVQAKGPFQKYEPEKSHMYSDFMDALAQPIAGQVDEIPIDHNKSAGEF